MTAAGADPTPAILTVAYRGHTVIIGLEGEVADSIVPAVKTNIDAALGLGLTSVVFDLEGVTSMASSALALLTYTAAESNKLAGTTAIKNPSDIARRLVSGAALGII